MTTVVHTQADRRSSTTERSYPLLSVMVWELRRFRANRLFWVQAFGFFCLAFFVTWAGHAEMGIAARTFVFNGSVANTSPWGMLDRLPSSALLLFGLFLPFVNAEGVTRDLSQRTHELLMTTALPNWAYVWGRFLASLLVSFGLALLLLAAYLSLGLVLHLTKPEYPLPAIGGVLLLWVGMVVSATILLSSLSFALGTAFPRQATLVKIAVLLGWFVGAMILPSIANLPSDQSAPPAWYMAWDPTSAAVSFGARLQYFSEFETLIRSATSTAQAQHILIAVEDTVPNVSTWFAPHLIEALLGLLLVVLSAFTFQRFRNAFKS